MTWALLGLCLDPLTGLQRSDRRDKEDEKKEKKNERRGEERQEGRDERREKEAMRDLKVGMGEEKMKEGRMGG